MLLRRDQLDANGRLVRRFAFLKLTTPPPGEPAANDKLPKASPKSRDDAPDPLADLPDHFRAPKRIGQGFVLSDAYSQPDGSVQLYYSDGLLGLSVFERAGELAWDELPAGGRTVELGGTRTKVYATSAGLAVVWGKDGLTYTCVTDASLDEIRAIAADIARSDDSDALDDISRFVTAPFSWG
jgi:negative regulator of sigma E activity